MSTEKREGPAINPAGSAINPEGETAPVTLADVKEQAQQQEPGTGFVPTHFPAFQTIDNYGATGGSNDIRAAGYFIRELAHSWEALKGSQARNDVEAILVAECAFVRKLQRERDGEAAPERPQLDPAVPEPQLVAQTSPASVKPAAAGIARNGNRKR